MEGDWDENIDTSSCNILVFAMFWFSVFQSVGGWPKMWKTNKINNDSLPPKSQNWANGFYFQFGV